MIRFTEHEVEKSHAALRRGLLERALGPCELWHDETKKAVGTVSKDQSFRGARLSRIARECLVRGGNRQAADLPDHEVVRVALKRDGAGYHSTGSFTNLLLDATEKSLRQSYDEAPVSFPTWTRRGESARSFKELNRIVFGDMNLPEEVPENHEYPEASTTDARESYRVVKHGSIFSVSMEAIVNDDLQAIVGSPRKQGAAMRRKINRDCCAILTDNDALADSITLFHGSSHGANLDATALAAGALDTGFAVMGTQSGTDASTVLGIMPRYLIVPSALAATALKLIHGDLMYPAQSSDIPLYGINGPRSLEVIADGQLDSLGSATNWWLAADQNVVDTVEVTYLQGEESPVLEREEGFTTDTIKYKIRQSYGVKAIDFRGLYQGNS